MQITQEGKVVKIAGALQIAEAEQFRDALLPLLMEERLVLDLSGVEAVDTAALQLLFSLLASRASMGRAVGLVAPSASVFEAASGLGLSIDHLIVPPESEVANA